MGQIQFLIALTLIGLFAIAVIGFATHFADDNNAFVDISDDAEISTLFNQTKGNMSNFRSSAESSYSSIANSSIVEGQTTTTGGQFIISNPSAIGTAKNIMLVGYNKIFGNGSEFAVFITTFFAVLVLIGILYAWKTWAGRSPD